MEASSSLRFRIWVDGAPHPADLLDDIARALVLHASAHTSSYLWHHDPFALAPVVAVASRASGAATVEGAAEAHLVGEMRFGDNVEDEWFVVWLLLELTAAFPVLCASVEDGDGQFLLVEAAAVLPGWLSPETSPNRVLLRGGHVLLIEPADAPADIGSEGGARLEDSLRCARSAGWTAFVHAQITAAIRLRLADYPAVAMQLATHYTRVLLPLNAALALERAPWLVSRAVESLCARDLPSMRASAKMRRFSPKLHPPVLCSVRFSRCLYAQLLAQRFTPHAAAGFDLPPPTHPAFALGALSAKLCSGLEMAAAEAEAEQRRAGERPEAAPADDAPESVASASALGLSSERIHRVVGVLLPDGGRTGPGAGTQTEEAGSARDEQGLERAAPAGGSQALNLARELASLIARGSSTAGGADCWGAFPPFLATLELFARPSAELTAGAYASAESRSWAQQLLLAGAQPGPGGGAERQQPQQQQAASAAASVPVPLVPQPPLLRDDSDGWLHVSAEELDALMRARAGQESGREAGKGWQETQGADAREGTAAGDSGGQSEASGLRSIEEMLLGVSQFMSQTSGVEGVVTGAHAASVAAAAAVAMAAAPTPATGAAARVSAASSGAADRPRQQGGAGCGLRPGFLNKQTNGAVTQPQCQAQTQPQPTLLHAHLTPRPEPAATAFAASTSAAASLVAQRRATLARASEDPHAPVRLDSVRLRALLTSLSAPDDGERGEQQASGGQGESGSESESDLSAGESDAEAPGEEGGEEAGGEPAAGGLDGLSHIMHAMDAELGAEPRQRRTPIPEVSSRARDESNLLPVDAEIELVKNLLAALDAEQGAPGPASAFLSSLGVRLPPVNETGREAESREGPHTGGTDPNSLDD